VTHPTKNWSVGFPGHLGIIVAATVALLASACGSEKATPTTTAAAERSTVVVTTSILGDVVENLAGDELNVLTVMSTGSDPHNFRTSAQQVAEIERAAALIVNGANFEEGLIDVIASAEDSGVPVFEAISAVNTIEYGTNDHDEHGHDDRDDHESHDGHDGHDEDGHDDHDDHESHGHEHEGIDPHFFTDPARMAVAANAIADFLISTVDGVDAEALRSNADAYIAELVALDAEVVTILKGLPQDRRVLITNHEVFGYFADRYDFEVLGTIIPSGSTADGVNARALAELARIIGKAGVPAVFSDTSSSDELVRALANEVGQVEVVELYSESLGNEASDGADYVQMVRANATRIARALSG